VAGLGDQQPADEEPAEHEEQVHADPSDPVPALGENADGSAGSGDLEMAPDHEDDGHGPEEVELREPPHHGPPS